MTEEWMCTEDNVKIAFTDQKIIYSLDYDKIKEMNLAQKKQEKISWVTAETFIETKI